MEKIEFKKLGKTTVVLDENFVRISRRGFLNFSNHGLKGEKTININQISGVQLKKPSFTSNGYIQFIFNGSLESKRGVFAAITDENSIMFKAKELDKAIKIQKYIENYQRSGTQNFTISGAEELVRFKKLLDEGIITQEDFNKKKEQIINS